MAPSPRDPASRIRAAQLCSYKHGITDGILLTIDALEGRALHIPDGRYQGPLTDPLLSYLAHLRRSVEQVQREEGFS